MSRPAALFTIAALVVSLWTLPASAAAALPNSISAGHALAAGGAYPVRYWVPYDHITG